MQNPPTLGVNCPACQLDSEPENAEVPIATERQRPPTQLRGVTLMFLPFNSLEHNSQGARLFYTRRMEAKVGDWHGVG